MNISPLLFLLFFAGNAIAYPDYILEYPDESRFALNFYGKYAHQFEHAAAGTGLSSSFLFGIIAPELSQYNSLVDAGETYALQVLYVQKGKAYSNFSIGYFQMKPSFAEFIEEQVKRDSILTLFYPDFAFGGNNRQSRVERVRRLSDLNWQLKYLQMFCILVGKKYSDMKFNSELDKFKFYASVYNIGFRSLADIQRICKLKLFPRTGHLKFHYEEVATRFYKDVNNSF